MIGSSDRDRALVYRQLAAVEQAGLPLGTALADAAARGGAAGRTLAPVAARLAAGDTIEGAFARGPFDPLEVALIGAAAKGGALPEGFTQLAELFEARAALKQKVAAGLCYPLVLLHAAVFLPSLGTLVGSGVAAYARETVLPLGALYAVVAGLVLGARALARAQPALFGRLQAGTPGVGGLVRARGLALGLRAFEALYSAGVPAIEALDTTAGVCPEPLAAAFRAVSRHAQEGADLAEAFAREAHAFPPHVLDAIGAGARTGQLDRLLTKAVERLEGDANLKQLALITVGGVGAFLLVAALVAYKAITFYANLYGSVGAF